MTWALAATVLAAAVLAARCRWTVVRVRGGSMEPALHDGDVLLARRHGHRPRSGAVAPARRHGHVPRHGDVVVLRRPPGAAVPPGAVTVHSGPVAPAAPGERWLIKRVVAVPGDPLPDGVADTTPGPVPPGTVVVFGDRPGLDSRLFGPVPIDTVHATVVRRLVTYT